MPYSSGIVPGGQIFQLLENITRRAFVPKVIYQLATSTPLLMELLKESKLVSGGLAPITVPVQGNALVQSQWVSFDGNFTPPTLQAGILNAEFNLASLLTAIPIYGQELHIQDEYAVIDIVEARLNDVYNQMRNTLSTAIFTNYSNQTQIIGLPAAVDNGTNALTYANINRTQNPWWNAYVVNNATQQTTTRALVMQYITGLTKYASGEMPNIGITSYGTWLALAQDFMGIERYMHTPNDGGYTTFSGGFTALEVAGVPIYPDPYCPNGTLYLLNTKYLYMAIDKNGSFATIPFQSTMANYQYAYIGGVLLNGQLVCTKPSAQGVINNLSYVSV